MFKFRGCSSLEANSPGKQKEERARRDIGRGQDKPDIDMLMVTKTFLRGGLLLWKTRPK